LVSAVLPDSSFIVTSPYAAPPPLPRHFAPGGQFLGTLGTAGDGPGEFREPGVTLVSADSLIVFDNRARRATVLLGGHTVRTFPLPEPLMAAIRLPDQSFVAGQATYQAGPSLRHLSPEGALLATFGDSAVTPNHDSPERFLALGPDGTLWSAMSDRSCTLTQWTTPGVERRRLTLCGAWFPPYDHYDFPTPDRAPLPRLTGLWIDQTGNIWLSGRVADPRWRTAFGPPVRREAQTVYPVTNPLLAMDGIVEVYSPDGQLLGARRHDASFRQMLPGPILITLARDGEGWTTPERWKVE
jgi:hypothetical protein